MNVEEVCKISESKTTNGDIKLEDKNIDFLLPPIIYGYCSKCNTKLLYKSEKRDENGNTLCYECASKLRIWQYQLDFVEKQTIKMPRCSKVLSISMAHNTLNLFSTVDSIVDVKKDWNMKDRDIYIYENGWLGINENLNDVTVSEIEGFLDFIGTVHDEVSNRFYHVFIDNN